MSDTQNTIDWQLPIEAVHEDGRVAAVALDRNREQPDSDGDYVTSEPLEDGSDTWVRDGSNWSGSNWRIRNVAQTARTADEQLTHYAERCQALVERLATEDGSAYVASYKQEARAIVASMVEVDGDVLIAREMRLEEVGEHASSSYKGYMNSGHYDNGEDVQKFVRAIRRGRALERGDKVDRKKKIEVAADAVRRTAVGQYQLEQVAIAVVNALDGLKGEN